VIVGNYGDANNALLILFLSNNTGKPLMIKILMVKSFVLKSFGAKYFSYSSKKKFDGSNQLVFHLNTLINVLVQASTVTYIYMAATTLQSHV